jgi:hypothetical protein
VNSRRCGSRTSAIASSTGKDGSVSGKTMPEAVMEGRLHIYDPAKLMEAISGGIGRQRAYGCGMLRLQPL